MCVLRYNYSRSLKSNCDLSKRDTIQVTRDELQGGPNIKERSWIRLLLHELSFHVCEELLTWNADALVSFKSYLNFCAKAVTSSYMTHADSLALPLFVWKVCLMLKTIILLVRLGHNLRGFLAKGCLHSDPSYTYRARVCVCVCVVTCGMMIAMTCMAPWAKLMIVAIAASGGKMRTIFTKWLDHQIIVWYEDRYVQCSTVLQPHTHYTYTCVGGVCKPVSAGSQRQFITCLGSYTHVTKRCHSHGQMGQS